MPFCPNCGAEINIEMKFCGSCGMAVDSLLKPADDKPATYLEQQAQVRTESIKEMNRMIDYFARKQREYNEYDECREAVVYWSNPNAAVKSVSMASYGFGVTLLILGLIFLVPGAISLLADFTFGHFKFSSVSLIIAGAGLLGVIFGPILIGHFNSRSAAERAKMSAYYNERFITLANDLTQHYNNYGYCAVGAEYTNPKILIRIAKLIRDGRAETIKEAINILHMEAHNSYMELQAQLTANASAKAADSASTAAFFSAASFLLK